MLTCRQVGWCKYCATLEKELMSSLEVKVSKWADDNSLVGANFKQMDQYFEPRTTMPVVEHDSRKRKYEQVLVWYCNMLSFYLRPCAASTSHPVPHWSKLVLTIGSRTTGKVIGLRCCWNWMNLTHVRRKQSRECWSLSNCCEILWSWALTTRVMTLILSLLHRNTATSMRYIIYIANDPLAVSYLRCTKFGWFCMSIVRRVVRGT